MAFDNPVYQRLFALLLQNDGNLYFHCTAGKDRTGGDGFLIMMALGMDEKDAVKEYLLSNQYLKQGFPRRVQIPVSLQFIPVPRIRSASRTFWGISFMA